MAEVRWTLMLGVLLLVCSGGCGLRVMSFNVQKFGQTKFANEEVVNHLVQVRRTRELPEREPVEPCFKNIFMRSYYWLI